ncbi:MAG: inorganic phosphate transporter [Hyphomicrobiales bacterium]|nr:inorganic phosphate transporter [Hyphomicrobiales bacterium]
MLKDSNLSLFFAALLACVGAYFIYWGLGYTNYSHEALFVFAALCGIFMAFNIGGNDVANSFGTSVGAGTLTIKQALVVAAIFEVSGAVIAGGAVTDTIRKGIIDLAVMSIEPLQLVDIMMSALLAAGLWLLFATKMGYPVSTTHSIVGGIVGSSMALGVTLSGFSAATALVQWWEIGKIAISWVLSPVLGGLASYALFYFIKHRILIYNEVAEQRLNEVRAERKEVKEKHKTAFERLTDIQQVAYAAAMVRDSLDDPDDPEFSPDDLETEYHKDLHRVRQKQAQIHAHRALEDYVPLVAAFGSMIITAMLLFKGLENLHLQLESFHNFLIMLMVGATVWMATSVLAKSLKGQSLNDSTFMVFSWLQVFTAAGFAFSHGSNDIANAIGPFAAILDVLRTGTIGAEAAIPPVAMITFGVALVAGLWFIGKEVIQTVGHKLTKMHPASGFSAELAAAAVVMLASIAGIPVSSTHILIGAVLGVGLVNRQANWSLMKPIALAWVITVPAAAALSAILFLILMNVF